jgi:hypothetical protein
MHHGILPDGEHVRRAIRWISDRRRDAAHHRDLELVYEAALRFDLSPLEEEWLMMTLAPKREVEAPS